MLGSPNLYRGHAPLAMRLRVHDLHAHLAPLDRYGVGDMSLVITGGIRVLVRGVGGALRGAACGSPDTGRNADAGLTAADFVHRRLGCRPPFCRSPSRAASGSLRDWKFGLPDLAGRTTRADSHHERRRRDFLQGLGQRPADRFQPRLASFCGRLGRPDAVLFRQGYRVIAHDRRGHGRSTQVGSGHDMDHYADDLTAVTKHLDLERCDPRGPLDRRGRSCALSGAAR